MKNVQLKLAVLGALSLVSVQAMATGLVALPSTGFSVTGGTSAYTLCNTTGGFGSGSATPPSAGANNTCAVFPANINTSPVSGYSLVGGTSVTRTITVSGQTLGFLDERVFRNSANTMCIYAKRLRMNDSASLTLDYSPDDVGNPESIGVNYLEVNDVALGGFSSTATVNAGYFFQAGLSPADSVIYRTGRAFTAVQYKNTGSSPFTPLTGYLQQPLTVTAPASGTEINGNPNPLGDPTGSTSASASQQTAAIRTNWVDFTMDITGGADEDGSSEPNSPFMYVQAGCTNAAPVALANSVRIRQTGQETQPFATVTTTGFARSGANASF